MAIILSVDDKVLTPKCIEILLVSTFCKEENKPQIIEPQKIPIVECVENFKEKRPRKNWERRSY